MNTLLLAILRLSLLVLAGLAVRLVVRLAVLVAIRL
jgi:hypothetical protein